MSSTPVTSSVAGDERSPSHSTPPSSPPSAEMSDDKDYDPVSENMKEEEKRMRAEARRERAADQERSQGWAAAGKSQQAGQFKKLLHLVEQSKVFASIMQQRMQQEETRREKRSDAEKRKLEKQEAKTEEAAVASQRKSTRATRSTKNDDAEEAKEEPSPKNTPTRGRGRPKKTQKDGSISSWLRKDDLNQKSGGMTVAEAVAEAAEEQDADGIATSSIGAQNLRSAAQPAAVTGGIMRSYQLEGLFWLRSLYENGLNGILADEMGLGKTVQTIAFLAFLREMRSFGPFLVVAPLSTLSNWIDEFAHWTPSIRALLYHGSPQERASLRSKELKKPGSETFPVVCTSYELCMNDRKFLSQYGWKFIIIDEGHRLKNLNCRLIKELKQYRSANRLLITGTPLQNNLAELWSLLNFLMPEVFDTLENFESFFDFSAVLEKGGHKEIIEREQKNSLVASLHAILKPFLLRRVKTDVETELPKKREYILYAPLTQPQKELYKHILDGTSRSYLEQQVVDRIVQKSGSLPNSRSASLKRKLADDDVSMDSKSARTSRQSTPGSTRSARKATMRKSYKEVSDRQYFRELEESSESEETDEEEQEEQERLRTLDLAKREIANKKLQNPIMQLRLACNSPHNFYWPWDEDETPDESLVASSGKLRILDRLIPHLLKHKHKVLIFSQFKTTLDILGEWAALHRGWPTCRIDGGVAADERRRQIREFNSNPETAIFLLSTRAGGQGINLAAADTVVLFDSDWNPQQDLQAQDRAHRIGQTRPVIVYRLATRGTVEQTLLEKADGKRRLEKLVIRKGKFRSLGAGTEGPGKDDVDELARILEQGDGEGVDMDQQGENGQLLSNEDLRVLTDRSEEAYAKAKKGEHAGERFKAVEAVADSGVLESVTRR